MKRKTIIILLVVIAAIWGGWYFLFHKEEKTTVYTVIHPNIGHIAETVTATGTVQPVDTVAVGTQVSGTIAHLYADFNSVVKKGQMLAQLDQTLFLASLQQAQGNLANAQSQLTFQKLNFSREKQLYDVGAISKSDFDNASYSLNSAKALVDAAEGTVKSAQKNLQLSTIYSPIDGTVLSRNVSEGQTVAASFNTPTLFTIAKDLTKMQVFAAVDEADIGNIQKGEYATFTVDAFLNDVFNGTIQEVRLNPVTSSNVVNYTTIINAPNKDLKLKPGMTANIMIYTRSSDSALLLPAKALQYNPDPTILPKGDSLVYLPKPNIQHLAIDEGLIWLKQGTKLIQRKVKTGLDDNTHIQILEGLSLSDNVITEESSGGASTEQSGGASASPFMPHRPARGGNKGGKK